MNNLEIVKSCYAGFSDGKIDVSIVGQVFDESLTFVESPGFPYAGTYSGPHEVFDRLAPRLAADWHSWNAAPEFFVAAGARVIVIGTYTARNATSGRDFVTRFAHCWELKDGKVVAYEQIVDSVPIVAAMP